VQKNSQGIPAAELLWASVREVLNIFQADVAGCDIVTVPHDILNKAIKLAEIGLKEMSLDTVKMSPTMRKLRLFALNQINSVTIAKTSSIFTEAMHASNSSRVPLMSPPS